MPLNFEHDIHALDHPTKDDMLAVQPGGDGGGDEELRAIGVGTSVGHGEKAGLGVLDEEGLIREAGPIDGLATSAISIGEVSSLDHELWDDTVEAGALVVQRLPRLPLALLASAKRPEVLDSLGDLLAVESHHLDITVGKIIRLMRRGQPRNE